jgi:DNA repair exonuclease SbcCD nuclease subunit
MQKGEFLTRFVFFTDLHLAAQPPLRRADDFAASMLKKLSETLDIAKEVGADALLFGGDWYNRHRIYAYSVIGECMRLIDAAGIPIYGIIGQHDLIGYNAETYATSVLAFQEMFTDYYSTIQEPVEFEDAVVYPCHVFDDLNEVMAQRVTKKKKAIVLVHKLLSEKDHAFDIIRTKSLDPCPYNLVLSGDLHIGYPIHKVGDTVFANPGAMARLTIADVDRKPKVLVIECQVGKDIEVREVPLQSVLPCDEAFTEFLADEVKTKPEVDATKFVKEMRNLEQHAMDVFDLLMQAGRKKGVRKEVLDYIFGLKDEDEGGAHG